MVLAQVNGVRPVADDEFVIPDDIVVLKWEKPSKWAGAIVRCYSRESISLDVALALQAAGDDGKGAARVFAEHVLISWNLRDKQHHPVPPTPDGITSIRVDLMNAIVMQWTEVELGVPAPLVEPFHAGRPSEEASMPMEYE